ncbi:MAG TPA: hypothetical protein VMM60_16130 [Ilumatobacter sp.]|nr:hypothetical protein [Ilumatobacter sp.]
MSDDQFDDQFDERLRHLARAARSEVERDLTDHKVESALGVATSDDTGTVRLGTTTAGRSPTRRWMPLAAAAAFIAVVVGTAVVMLGEGDERITSQSVPPTSEGSDPTIATSTIVASTATVPAPTTTISAATTVAATEPAPPATSTTTSTTVPPLSPPPPPVDMIESLDEVPYERYLPLASCLEDDCAQIEYDATGAAWTFRHGQLTNHMRGGAVIDLPEPWASVDIRDIYLLAIGPDDVAYFNASPAPERADLVGISLAAPDDGVAVRHLVDALDISGDTDYVATSTGLVKVGCCGGPSVRPSPDAELLAAWFERAAAQPPLPTVTFNAEDASITRGDTTWSFDVDPQQLMSRGMPQVTATHDGGVIGRLNGLSGADYVVRGWPDGTSSTAAVSMSLFTVGLTPEGFAVFVANDGFVAADLFADHPSPPLEPLTIDFETGIVTPDNGWQPPTDDSAAARLVRAVQIAGPVSLGSRRTVTALDPDAPIVVVATEGFFDDSVLGSQLTIDFVNETIGWANTCQAGRGHQDYRAALCV